VTLHEDIQAALDRLAADLEDNAMDNELGPEEDGVKGHVILDTTRLGGIQVIVHDWDSAGDSDDGLGGLGIRGTRTNREVVGHTPRPPVAE